MKKPIGRIIATEKVPTTMDKFTFWTDSDLKLHAFDIVKVKHIDDSYSFGVIENISHITDAQSFLTSFISSDFGDVTVDEPTLRVGMNYVEASVSYNNKNLYTPVHNNEPVYLASENEITMALGLDKIQNPLVCGSLKMYEGTSEEITLPVNLNSKFILGPEGAHLNISGISGLASKTSYAMFLMKAVQEQYLKMPVDSEESVAFVIFNVKGKDLMAIHSPNDFKDDSDGEKERVYQEYKDLGLSTEPFKKVKYFIPYSSNSSAKQSTYLPKEDIEEYIREGQLQKFKYSYEDDKESLEMLFADIDDPQQTMEAIISKIIDATDPDFGGGKVNTWEGFREKVDELSQKSQTQGRGTQRNSNEISVLSWRKFKRIVNKAIKNDDMFANRADSSRHECRLADAIKHISNNDVYVIDVAKLTEDKELYYRMRINVDLCEELGVTIYSFPMKYHPINDPEYFKNRDYLGKHWNRKFIRAVQAVLNSTKGKIGKGIEFFEEAFGRDLDEFYKILWMPETFIIYRRKYDKKLRERLADRYKNHSSEDCDLANEWWTKFCSLPAEKLEIAKSIISLNKFKEGDYDCTDKEILDVLSYYSITRDIAEQSI